MNTPFPKPLDQTQPDEPIAGIVHPDDGSPVHLPRMRGRDEGDRLPMPPEVTDEIVVAVDDNEEVELCEVDDDNEEFEVSEVDQATRLSDGFGERAKGPKAGVGYGGNATDPNEPTSPAQRPNDEDRGDAYGNQ